jgi:caffeoyl-CoA O-methyltransferase
MFHDIPQPLMMRMRELEQIDVHDRVDGTPHEKRLRQISPEIGRFIAILAASAPDGRYIEIGTSAAYSTMWLSLACRAVGRRITTFEILGEKVQLARKTIDSCGISDVVELIHGDAVRHLAEYEDIAFCFLDGEKEVYERCYELVVPRMVNGAILVADNAISHETALRPMIDRVLQDNRVDALVVPIGTGELVCRLTTNGWGLRTRFSMFDFFDSSPPSRVRTIVYWIATIILVLECEVGGIMGGLRLQPFLGTIQHLGYPTYFMTIHTIWYILGGLALLVPRFPRLKEWAYAGLFFIYTGAFMSHLARR